MLYNTAGPMKKTITAALCASFLILTSCKDKPEPPKVIYDTKPKASVKPASLETITVADLPLQIEGTGYLIHPLSDLNIGGRKGPYSGSDNSSGYQISNYREFELTGYLRNIKFQKTDSDSLSVLTDKLVLIQTVTYLKAFADKSKQQLLVYTLTDMDTNKDGNVNSDDIKTLYISHINGEGFTKLSPDYEELIDWNVIDGLSRLYFRTSIDSNKNGEFDKNDEIHYHYVDLSMGGWEVKEYKPI
jgi:hypothetical protein